MYEEFYGFKANPFKIAPSPMYFYQSKTHRKAFINLYHGLVQEQGILVLIGPAGTGKTTILEALSAELGKLGGYGRGEYKFAHLTYAPSAEEIIKAATAEITGKDGFEDNSQAIRFLKNFLLQEKGKRKFVLVMDEAQNLDLKALEELRMLSNLEVPHESLVYQEKLLSTILVGQPGLDNKLRYPALAQLRQRITTYSRLNPIFPEEIPYYLEYRMKTAGYTGDLYSLFTEEAVGAVIRYSQGIPRLVNSVCHEALVYGYATAANKITLDFVKEAVESLELIYEAGVGGKEEAKPHEKDMTLLGDEIKGAESELLQERVTKAPIPEGFRAPSRGEIKNESLNIESYLSAYTSKFDEGLREVKSEVEGLSRLVSQIQSQQLATSVYSDKSDRDERLKKVEADVEKLSHLGSQIQGQQQGLLGYDEKLKKIEADVKRLSNLALQIQSPEQQVSVSDYKDSSNSAQNDVDVAPASVVKYGRMLEETSAYKERTLLGSFRAFVRRHKRAFSVFMYVLIFALLLGLWILKGGGELINVEKPSKGAHVITDVTGSVGERAKKKVGEGTFQEIEKPPEIDGFSIDEEAAVKETEKDKELLTKNAVVDAVDQLTEEKPGENATEEDAKSPEPVYQTPYSTPAKGPGGKVVESRQPPEITEKGTAGLPTEEIPDSLKQKEEEAAVGQNPTPDEDMEEKEEAEAVGKEEQTSPYTGETLSELEAGKIEEVASAPLAQPEEKYTVQIAAFKTKEKAVELAETLWSKGYPAFTEGFDMPGKGVRYRVRVGNFETKEEAMLYGDDLKGQEPLVKSVFVTVQEGGLERLTFEKQFLTFKGSSAVNIRQGPGMEYTVLGVAQGDETLEKLGEESGGWVKVKTQRGAEGWVAERLVKEVNR